MKSGLYPRQLSLHLTNALQDTPAVMIHGPRQCGKTTLVKQYNQEMPYFTLDDDNLLRAVKTDPVGFIRDIDKAVIDEIQHAPELLRAIKLSIDEDRRPGRFILTGSANLLALPSISDSLAGRMEILTMLPLSHAEIHCRESVFLEKTLAYQWRAGEKFERDEPNCYEIAWTGGYPEMLKRPLTSRRTAWAQSYLQAILERDIKDLATIDRLESMPRLLTVLAHMSGQLVNYTQIGGQLGLDHKTARKYVGLLENLFLVKTVLPWGFNEIGRLIKTPKLHFIDAGLQATCVRLTLEECKKDKSRFGSTLETWVYGELAKAISFDADPWQIYHYRDKDQVEVDFILERADRLLIGIEVKAAATVTERDFHGLKKVRQFAGDLFSSGIVLYDGNRILSFGEKYWAIPLICL